MLAATFSAPCLSPHAAQDQYQCGRRRLQSTCSPPHSPYWLTPATVAPAGFTVLSRLSTCEPLRHLLLPLLSPYKAIVSYTVFSWQRNYFLHCCQFIICLRKYKSFQFSSQCTTKSSCCKSITQKFLKHCKLTTQQTPRFRVYDTGTPQSVVGWQQNNSFQCCYPITQRIPPWVR